MRTGRPHGPALGEKFTEDLKRYWPTMSAREISAITDYKVPNIYKWARFYGLKHDEATVQRMHANSYSNYKSSLNQETREKIRKARLRNHRMEKFRVMSGMPQKTKYHISTMPARVRYAINGLIARRNYFRTEPGYTLYYDSKTNRCNYHCYNEEYYTKKYGIQFVKADES